MCGSASSQNIQEMLASVDGTINTSYQHIKKDAFDAAEKSTQQTINTLEKLQNIFLPLLPRLKRIEQRQVSLLNISRHVTDVTSDKNQNIVQQQGIILDDSLMAEYQFIQSPPPIDATEEIYSDITQAISYEHETLQYLQKNDIKRNYYSTKKKLFNIYAML